MADLPEARIAMESVKGVPSTEPSMEDILASIRRILNDDAPAHHDLPPVAEEEILVLDDTMLAKPANDHLHDRPVVAQPASAQPSSAQASSAQPSSGKPAMAQSGISKPGPVAPPLDSHVLEAIGPVSDSLPEPAVPIKVMAPPAVIEPAKPEPSTPPSSEVVAPITQEISEMAEIAEHPALSPKDELLAPQTKSAAGAALASLVQKVSDERVVPVYRNGPTLEDLVREEIRPVLKAWLDTQLPAMVERLVRAEIQRLTTNL